MLRIGIAGLASYYSYYYANRAAERAGDGEAERNDHGAQREPEVTNGGSRSRRVEAGLHQQGRPPSHGLGRVRWSVRFLIAFSRAPPFPSFY